jgi:hypothetical protein
MIEAEAAQSGFNIGVALRSDHFHDDIHIVGWPGGREFRMIQQQVHDGTADKGIS